MFRIFRTLLSVSLLWTMYWGITTVTSMRGTDTVEAATEKIGATLTNGPIAFPAGFMLSVKSYGAVGDGVTDDTAAIQKALADGRSSATADYYGKPKALYFPPGTYLVHDTLQWVGCCVTLQGDGATASVIRLAPNSAGFANTSSPKPLIITPSGNTSFHQNIWDIGLEIGSGNPGATALNYISNNSGSVHNLQIISDDGAGHSGIDLTRNWAGPLMLRNVKIQGFDVGIDLANAEYSSTIEDVTVANQNLFGIRNLNQPVNIRSLSSSNRCPALTNTGGFVILIDAELAGGDPKNSALQTNSTVYLRNVTSGGYAATLKNMTTSTYSYMKGKIGEYLLGSSQTLTGSPGSASLNLNVQETPSYSNSNMSTWGRFAPRWYGDTGNLQALFNSGSSTIYFPFAAYYAANEAAITVPDSVMRVVGFSSIINGNSAGVNGGGIRLVITSNSPTPLIVEQFGYGLKIDHRGTRPVVLKDAKIVYTSTAGAGNLFLEDIEMQQALTIQISQQVWARQLNAEFSGTKISNQGGSLWILGLKTENPGTVIDTELGGKTELLGSLIYPAHTITSSDIAFKSVDSQVSYMYGESVYCSNCGYSIQVQEWRSGNSTKITSSPSTHYRMPLFIGYN